MIYRSLQRSGVQIHKARLGKVALFRLISIIDTRTSGSTRHGGLIIGLDSLMVAALSAFVLSRQIHPDSADQWMATTLVLVKIPTTTRVAMESGTMVRKAAMDIGLLICKAWDLPVILRMELDVMNTQEAAIEVAAALFEQRTN